MKKKSLLLLGGAILFATSCSTTPKYEQKNVLLIASGFSGDSTYQNDVYFNLINKYEKNKYNVKLNLLELGNESSVFEERIKSEVLYEPYDYVVVLGDDLSTFVESTIKTYLGYKFIFFDNESNEKYSNSISLNFTPEDFGYLMGENIKQKHEKDVGYFYRYQNSFNNRKLYGMLTNLNENSDDIKISCYGIEEKNNEAKSLDYIKKATINNNVKLFAEDVKDNAVYFADSLDKNEIITSAVTLDTKKDQVNIYKDYNKMFNYMLENIAKDSFDFSSNINLGIKDGYLSSKGITVKEENIKTLDDSNFDEFESLKNKYFVDVSKQYDVLDSVYGLYHEAVPNCSEANDWKHAPRPGGENGLKPASWKALGIWSTIYAQENTKRSVNTGIEFKNMKIYGYSKRRGWVFIEHANPVGAFYDENFVNDYHTNFEGKYFNNKLDKSTRILLDKETKGFNYHPFGEQTDLEAIDMLDIEYVYSTLEIRLFTWDQNKPSDIEDAKYVANIGGDWWVEKGATWKPDWSANKDVSLGQFRTLTKEWKTLEMCSAPVEVAKNILGNKEFLQ